MLEIRLPAFILAAALTTLNGPHRDSHSEPSHCFTSDLDRLQGAWEILDTHRDGVADPTQIGGRLTFAGNEVSLAPKIVQIHPAYF